MAGHLGTAARADAVSPGDRAKNAEADAVSQRDRARKAVDEMYTQVAEKWLAQQPRLELVQAQFLSRRWPSTRSSPAYEAPIPRCSAAVEAEQRAGNIHQRLGEYKEAALAYGRGVEIGETLMAAFPNTHRHRELLALNLNGLGIVLRETGQFAQAERAYHRAPLNFKNCSRPSSQESPSTGSASRLATAIWADCLSNGVG